MNVFEESVSEIIWDIKYRYRLKNQIIDQTIEDTWRRVAHAVARVETSRQRKTWEQRFYELLENFNFLPGGRILAGAGTNLKVTLFNCFVMNIAKDSLPGIFAALKEGALTLQQGGGVGYDFSILRPSGQLVAHTGSIASGPVSFMRIWDSMSATMQSSGSRRGAMMGTLRCDHPDIEEFIKAKADPTQLRQFNISVLVTDEFMQAVQKDDDWELVFPVTDTNKKNGKIIQRRWSGSPERRACRVVRSIRARYLWKQIITAAYQYAEPGVLFEDTINRQNPLGYTEWISATNPCGEIPLPPYGACNLGSINLTHFVLDPFTPKARLNFEKLEMTAHLASRFLDNIISISRFPLLAQRQAAIATRRIGLGFTGLADVLVMLGVKYGSQQSLAIAKNIAKTIAYATWNASIDLAHKRGRFPLFNKKQYLAGEFVGTLPAEIHKGIKRYGIRNSHHNAIAPAGTISLLANNISNGLEPIFKSQYTRKIRISESEINSYQITDYAFRHWQKMKKPEQLPPAWCDTHSITPEEHLQIQAAVQPFLDNAISKTINIPATFPFEKLHEVYTKAYELGLKGCTVFRPNPITGNVLTADIEQCCSSF